MRGLLISTTAIGTMACKILLLVTCILMQSAFHGCSYFVNAGKKSYLDIETNLSVGPGLAQLVERLTQRYSEGMSSNPDNLTSAGNSIWGQDWKC